MLGRLLKYDLKWSIKLIAIFLGLGVIFTILGMLFDLIPNSLLFDIVAKICKGASIAMYANALCNSIFRSWARMNLNFYKDESYLTHTLPIKKSTHLASKVISQLILIIVSSIAFILGIVIMYVDKDVLELIKTTIEFTSNTLNTSVASILIVAGFLISLEIIFLTFCGNFGIIVGHMFNKRKMIMSLIFGFLSYILVQYFLLMVFGICSLFNSDLYNIMFQKSNIMNYGSFMLISYIAIILYTTFNIILYILTNYFFKKGVNID